MAVIRSFTSKNHLLLLGLEDIKSNKYLTSLFTGRVCIVMCSAEISNVRKVKKGKNNICVQNDLRAYT